MNSDGRRIPVLIVGGGPVGLALAADLGWRGMRCELVEQTDGAITTPKMNEVNVRTMEFCRRWGIADQVLNCPFPADYPFDVVFVTSLSGHELARMRRPPRAQQKPGNDSPTWLQICSQIWFDPILRKFAQSFPTVRLRHRTRLETFQDTGEAVICDIVDLQTGVRERVIADYLVACDGANSMIRNTLGIGLAGQGSGDGVLGHPLHLFFRAPDLLDRCDRDAGVFFLAIDRDGLWANIRIIDPANAMWRLMVLDSDGKQTPQSVDRDALVRRAVGRPYPVEHLGLSIWTRRSVVAEQYVQGRVLIAGDAAHQLSPTGALGMNTGVGDAVDLGWKLAAVLEGWGGPGLLASYDSERRPIGVRNVGMAAEFYLSHEVGEDFTAIEDEGETGGALRGRLGESLLRDVGRMFRTNGLQLGYRYEGSPIVVPDGTSAPPDNPERFIASARPGSRAPHHWLADGRSTIDLFGRGFVLLRFPGAPNTAAIEDAALSRKVPLKVIDLDSSEIAASHELRLVLVRPDGHVAWRGNAPPADAGALIDCVRGTGPGS